MLFKQTWSFRFVWGNSKRGILWRWFPLELLLACWISVLNKNGRVNSFSFTIIKSHAILRRLNPLRVAEKEATPLIPKLGNDSSLEQARERLQQHFDFPLDDWQAQAGYEIWNGNNVIVCAPTGAGKTVVGEMALHISFEAGSNAIYTTPLKALSNQKFAELRPVFGKENVGLSTGDMSINRGARMTVMTTEVYRNMAWRSSSSARGEEESPQESRLLNRDDLQCNAVVVLDEFHYMGQPGRGGVWEECVITSPPHTQIVGLSATLPNALRLAEWMEGVTGRKTVLVQFPGKRPVPLRYLFASRDGLYPLFREPDAGPGAPKGLLGWRGDGEPEAPTRRTKAQRKGFGRAYDKAEKISKRSFPKGLQINSALKMAMDKRTRKVNRAIERQKIMAAENADDDEIDWKRPRTGGMSPREERRERDRLLKIEMRRSVPSLSLVLTRLNRRGLLPAIFFIFSRVGCDRAAESVVDFMRGQGKPSPIAENNKPEENTSGRRKRSTRQRGRRHSAGKTIEDGNGRSFRSNGDYVSDDLLSSVLDWSAGEAFSEELDVNSRLSSENWGTYADLGLLTTDEVKEVKSRVSTFNNENKEIAFDDTHIEQFLFGVGSHHAGMLAAHKAFVEALYRAQLMKVVFATETLAAGINMPARTTVICSLAKRGDGSTMNLLETSNLLQMAGRAGRRGMDTDGTCVISATPFEGAKEATSILTSEIKPIVSQFTPSYSLAVNLIARGEGKLNVAQQLVQKSFAMWEKRQTEDSLDSVLDDDVVAAADAFESASHENFIQVLMNALGTLSDPNRVQEWFLILGDIKALKKSSRAFVGATRLLDIEQKTRGYLERELGTMNSLATDEDKELLGDLFEQDQALIRAEIETQRKRVLKTEKEISRHPFSSIVVAANQVMEGSRPEGKLLLDALKSVRTHNELTRDGPLSADELSLFAKSAVVMKRQTRKLNKATPNLDTSSVVEMINSAESSGNDDTWEDTLAITRVLLAYGCLSTDSHFEVDDMMSPGFCESQTYEVTQAGVNIGLLGFENSLWCLVAMGGAWDTIGASSELDEFDAALETFDEEDESESEPTEANMTKKPQQEAEMLISLLRQLSPSEMAGYVSCLVAEGSRSEESGIEYFQRWPVNQQRVIQCLLSSLERMEEVQKKMSIDEASRRCELGLTSCEVVTAWAAGCTWSEAVEMSGTAPGDLARTLSRVLDALRQFGNLPYMPVRANLSADGEYVKKSVSDGIHPDISELCRDAARSIDRYPVKDPLPFETDEDEVVEEDFEDDIQTSAEAGVPPDNEIDLEESNDDDMLS